MTGGYVLAGGRSSRMGSDKALLAHPRSSGSETLLLHAARAVKGACGSCVVVGDPAKYGLLQIPVIPDRWQGIGPLGGIEAALSHTGFNWNLITACDMPGLTADALREFIQRCSGMDADCVVPLAGGREQPLCALYRRTALNTVQEALRAGERKVMRALQTLRVTRIEIAGAALFHNVNTPEDWRAFAAR